MKIYRIITAAFFAYAISACSGTPSHTPEISSPEPEVGANEPSKGRDPFLEHHKSMLDAIRDCDEWKVQQLIKTPYIDPSGYQATSYVFEVIRSAPKEKQICIPIMKLLIASGATPDKTYQHIKQSGNTLLTSIHLILFPRMGGFGLFEDRDEQEVLDLLLEKNFYARVPGENTLWSAKDFFAHVMGFPFGQPESYFYLLDGGQALDFRDILEKNNWATAVEIFRPLRNGEGGLAAFRSLSAALSHIDINQLDPRGNSIVDTLVLPSCRLIPCSGSGCRRWVRCESSLFPQRKDMVQAVLKNRTLNPDLLTRKNSYGFTPAERTWGYANGGQDDKSRCLFSEGLIGTSPINKMLNEEFSAKIGAAASSFPIRIKRPENYWERTDPETWGASTECRFIQYP